MLDDHDMEALGHALNALGGFAGSPELGGREYNTPSGSSLGGRGPGGSIAASQAPGGMSGGVGNIGGSQLGRAPGGSVAASNAPGGMTGGFQGNRDFSGGDQAGRGPGGSLAAAASSIANAVNRGGMGNSPGFGYGGFMGLDPRRGVINPQVAGGKTSLPGSTFNKPTPGNEVAMNQPPAGGGVPGFGALPMGTGPGRAALAAMVAGDQAPPDPTATAMGNFASAMPSMADALTGTPGNPLSLGGFPSNPMDAATAAEILGAGTLASSRLPKDQERVPQEDTNQVATNPFAGLLPQGLPPAPDPAAAARRGLVPGAPPVGLLGGTAEAVPGPVPSAAGTLAPPTSIAAGETVGGFPYNTVPSGAASLTPPQPSYFGDIPSWPGSIPPALAPPEPTMPSIPGVQPGISAPYPPSGFYGPTTRKDQTRVTPDYVSPTEEQTVNIEPLPPISPPLPRAKPPVPVRTRDYGPIIPRDQPRPPLPSRVPPAQPRGGFVPPVPMRAEDRRMYGPLPSLGSIFNRVSGGKGTNTLQGGAGPDLLTTPAFPLHGPGGSIAASRTPGGMMGTTPMAPSGRGLNAQYDPMQELLANQRKRRQDAESRAAEDAAAEDQARSKRRRVIPKPRGLLS